MALGCFGECFMELGPAATKYVDSMAPLIKQGLENTTHENVRRNSAFALGHMVKACGSNIGQENLLQMLSWLGPLCSVASEKDQKTGAKGADVDNAVSAVSRMIEACPGMIPLESILPVMLGALPLKCDVEEGEQIYTTFINLIRAQDPAALALYPQILGSLAQAATYASRVPDSTKEKIAAWKSSMVADPAYRAACAGVDAAYQAWLVAA